MVAKYRGKYELTGLNGPISDEMLRQLDMSYDICHEIEEHNVCEQCGRCCYQHSIIVLDSDLERMAEKLQMPLRSFITTYLYRDKGKWFIKKTNPCAFLREDKRCAIHDARPEVCRDFPYTVSKFMSRVYLSLKDPDCSLDLEYMDNDWPCTQKIKAEASELIRRRRDPKEN